MDMNKSMYMGNGKQNEHYIQQVPTFYQNSAHNHQYYSFSTGNSAISIDELTELNLNSPINITGQDTTILDQKSNSYKNAYYFPKAVLDQQYSAYHDANLSYASEFHSMDVVPMNENPKGFQSMSMPITSNDYHCSRNYSVDSLKSFFGSNSPGYPVYKKTKDPYFIFSEELFTSINVYDDQQRLEKYRKRRESHNAVERRRRDNINEKIQELATLVSKNPFKDKIKSNTDIKNINNTDFKPNKGEILRKSVDYIRYLENHINELNSRSQWLESEVIRLGGNSNAIDKLDSAFHTSNIPGTPNLNSHDSNNLDIVVKKEHFDELDIN